MLNVRIRQIAIELLYGLMCLLALLAVFHLAKIVIRYKLEEAGVPLQDQLSPGVVVIPAGSDKGQEKIANFSTSPEDALLSVEKHISDLKSRGLPAHKSFRTIFVIVEDDYVVAHRYKMKDSLEGYYLNGFAGDIRFVSTGDFVLPDSSRFPGYSLSVAPKPNSE